MKKNLIKYKITVWYTAVLIAVIFIMILGIVGYTNYYISKEARAELEDEVSDFYKEISELQDISSDVLDLHYYDDGIILSIYDANGLHVKGFSPDDFPAEIEFEAGTIRKIHTSKGLWLILDKVLTLKNQKYWIRGIYPLNLIDGMTSQLFAYMTFIIPFLILFAAFMGYQLMKRSLAPIYSMTKMADDIAHSADLSLRLPEVKTRDELAYLTDTFNFMLQHLSDIFMQETHFTSDAAHELRTPISVILSHCDYCLSELNPDPEVREELTLISKKAYWMSDLVSQLLLIARAESNQYHPDFEPTDLHMLAETVIEELHEKASQKNIHLRYHSHLDSLMLNCDFNLMLRVFMNLIENGIQYGREDGFVDVTISMEDDNCLILFRDDGIGIPQEVQDKIWNRFYRVDASHSADGFGLGLFMVKWIIELHKGKIELISTPGLGSLFKIYLPMCG